MQKKANAINAVKKQQLSTSIKMLKSISRISNNMEH